MRIRTALAFFALLLCFVCTISADDLHEPAFQDESTTGSSQYRTPVPQGKYWFLETFDTDYSGRWYPSNNGKYNGLWTRRQSLRGDGIVGDYGLSTTNEARHYGIAALFDKPVDLTKSDKKSFVVQYEVKLEGGLSCGGAYMKLLQHQPGFSPENLQDSTPYIIMFGPDKCGSEKVHFILRHQNPITKKWEEKHFAPPKPLSVQTDSATHLYTLHLYEEDGSSYVKIYIDNQVMAEGDILHQGVMNPSINPPATVDDPTDKKPADWVDAEKIPDPDAKKPEDWDEDAPVEVEDPHDTKPEDWLDNEPQYIPDPNAKKPEYWNDEEDGTWEAPLVENPVCQKVSGCGQWRPRLIKNPEYKGKWTAPLIPNPKYKGPWKARQIPNPEFYEDKHPVSALPAISGIAFELWTMQPNIMFDNIIVTNDIAVAQDFASRTWAVKYESEKKAKAAAEATLLNQYGPVIRGYIPPAVLDSLTAISHFLKENDVTKAIVGSFSADDLTVVIVVTVLSLMVSTVLLFGICCCCCGGNEHKKKLAALDKEQPKKEEEAKEEAKTETTEEDKKEATEQPASNSKKDGVKKRK